MRGFKTIEVGDGPNKVPFGPPIARTELVSGEDAFNAVRLVLPRHVVGTSSVRFEQHPSPGRNLDPIEFALLVGL